LEELFPNWKELGAPLNQEVKSENMYYLTEKSQFKLPIIKGKINKIKH
jgi:electron-transferring-flavoprotein dehydrogenase